MGFVEIEGNGMRAALRGLGDLRPVLAAVGVQLLATAQRSFRDQRLGATNWPARMAPNIAGIVSDLNAGRNPPGRRFQDRPALVDTGRLRQSITFEVRGDEVAVGTSLDYAKVHQEGGVQQIKLQREGREGLKRLLRRRKDLQKSLGWLFRKPSFEIRIRKRSFVGITPEDVKAIGRLVRERAAGGR